MNKSQLLQMTPDEIIAYKREQLILLDKKTNKLETLKNATHDCKGELGTCGGCALIESVGDEITYHDLQINLIDSVLESVEFAMKPEVREEQAMVDKENSSAVMHELN